MVKLIRSDLQFILDQIISAETGALPPNPFLPWGLRQVDGRNNNIIPGREDFGGSDRVFPRLLTPFLRQGEDDLFIPGINLTSYTQTSGNVFDSQPRVISNLIADASPNNPAAVVAAGETPGAFLDQTPGRDGIFNTGDAGEGPVYFIPNQTPDAALSAPYNSWFTIFGQFFDHGLDLVNKGGNGTVFVPLKSDDVLYDFGADGVVSADDGTGADGVQGTADDSPNFIALTRATIVASHPGADGIAGTSDDIHDNVNQTTPWVDQNQTYTSHPSHQVFHREYVLDGNGKPVSTGKLLDGATGGLANWAEIKAQARNLLGINLVDSDVTNVPLIRTDEYGRFIPDPISGFAQIVVGLGPDGLPNTADDIVISGTPLNPASTATAVRINHAFLDDIAHSATPTGKTADADVEVGNAVGPTEYDNELLDAHFVTGDGRGNENIALTAVHHVFHSEHNRLVDSIKTTILETGDTDFIASWLLPNADQTDGVQDLEWNGERLFQAAKFATEMQYQHLVFEEFARKVQPQVNVFAAYEGDLDAAIFGEFAHVVYRFGHSMLTETVGRIDETGAANDLNLIAAFLNPVAFNDSGVDADAAAASIVRGMTRQVGNELDEFVTDAVRNSLLGLPLDLAAINITRGRDVGIPSLNAARRDFNLKTGDSQLRPYTSWADFTLNVRNPASVVNFIAAYGTHETIVNAATTAAKREAATLLVMGGDGEPLDRIDFLNSTGSWASGADGVTITGLDDIDFWIGGLAEKQTPFGGLLGSTFNFVFETQMELLQDQDRFYYLARTANLNFLTELEGNSFAALIMRNLDVGHLPGDVFTTPGFILEIDQTKQIGDDPVGDVIRGENFLQYTGDEHVVLGGTSGNDTLIASEGDDTVWGDEGNDRIEGGDGVDILNGGDGDDIITDQSFDDNIKGGEGNDAIQAGQGFDLVLGGGGKDFIDGGEDPNEVFGGREDDFIIAGDSSDVVFGGEGDDWIEGGGQSDLLQGDNGDPFQTSSIIGNDVIIGGSGNDDYDAESGDDIMVGSPGTERNEGMLGFDWVTYQDDTFGVEADMNIRVFAPPALPGSPESFLDRFDLVEGLSGSAFSDILRGDDANATTMVDNTLTNIALIDGLQDFLGANVTVFTGGNILIGGDRSDVLEGRGGNDLIDGDAFLQVSLAVIDPNTGAVLQTAKSMTELSAGVFAGQINPGNIHIVREILFADGSNDVDTAVFSDIMANYTLEGIVGVDLDGDGFITVSHDLVTPGDGLGADGVDRVRNIERLQFSDDIVTLGGPENGLPMGMATISDTTPKEDQVLTASLAGVTDPDNISSGNPTGAVTGPIAFYWQAEDEPGSGIFFDIEVELLGEIVPATGPTFTPGDAQVGLALRVRAIYQDADGVLESVFSNPTAPVANENDAPQGDVTISDTSPTELQAITASNTLTDADGPDVGAGNLPVTYRWESSTNGSVWTAIAGATSATFTPAQAQVGLLLRVVASYTDATGVNESKPSAATIIVGDNITGSGGNNTQNGTAGQDFLSGLGGNDTMNGNGENDILDGGAGNDTLNGGAGADLLIGGTGNDTFIVDDVGDQVSELANGGTDTVRTPFNVTTAGANVEHLVFIGAGDFVGTGNDLNNAITGGTGNDSLVGGLGTDTLTGGSGNDTLTGGGGNDSLVGGAGDDTYFVDAAGDTVSETTTGAAGGTDIVFASGASFQLGTNVENLTYVGSAAFTGTGNSSNNIIIGGALNDTLSGSSGNDTINGGDGADSIDGGSGNDLLTGGTGDDVFTSAAGNDTFVYTGAFGNDRITGFGASGTGQDLLDISGLGITAADFGTRVVIADAGVDVLITIDGTSTIRLLNVSNHLSVDNLDFILGGP